MDTLQQKATVIVRRRTGMTGMTLQAKIFADEIKIGELGAGQSREFVVDSGPVRLHAMHAYATTEPLELRLQPGESAELALRWKHGMTKSAIILEVIKASSIVQSTAETSEESLTITNAAGLEERLSTLERAHSEAERASQQALGSTGMVAIIGGIILLILAFGFRLPFGLLIVLFLSGIVILFNGIGQRSGAKKSSAKASARLTKIDSEAAEIRSILGNSSHQSVSNDAEASKANLLEGESKAVDEFPNDESTFQDKSGTA